MIKTDISLAKTEPLEHQLAAISFLIRNEFAALMDEQGVGKTKEMIDALIILMSNKNIDSALIICPKTLMNTWKLELKKHSYLTPAVIAGNAITKSYNFMSSPNVYIVNYEGAISEQRILRLLLQSERFAIVLDESQRIKNPSSLTYKTINSFRDLATRRYILSGTLMANRPVDLWSQYYFLDGGKSLGNDYGNFKKKYDTKNIDEKLLSELWLSISPISMRRLKEKVLKLPPKHYIKISLDLTFEQKKIYDRLKAELKIDINTIDGNTIIDESNSILKKLLRLAQIASNPKLIVENYTEIPVKFIYLDRLVNDIIAKNEKLIIWSGFVGNVNDLKKRYLKHGSVAIYGKVAMADRNAIVERFQTDPNCKVLVANPSAAREGLTLTAANHAVYVDRTFNLVDYLQSQDRIHRISQNKPCYIYKLMAKNTIDEFIEDRLTTKQAVAGIVQGDATNLNLVNMLTKGDIERILN